MKKNYYTNTEFNPKFKGDKKLLFISDWCIFVKRDMRSSIIKTESD
jgi:hypothetical protein